MLLLVHCANFGAPKSEGKMQHNKRMVTDGDDGRARPKSSSAFWKRNHPVSFQALREGHSKDKLSKNEVGVEGGAETWYKDPQRMNPD